MEEAGRSVRSGEAGYTALIGQDYTRERTAASQRVLIMGKKFDSVGPAAGSRTGSVYAADELVTAVFTNKPVRLLL